MTDNWGVAGNYLTNLSDAQWARLRPLLADDPHKRGPKFGGDVRLAVDALLYVAHTGCQWRYLPTDLGPWTVVWPLFRRWSRSGRLSVALLDLHGQARRYLGRAEPRPSLLVIDSHLARGATNGGGTFHTRGGPRGATKGAKRVIAIDVTGLPLAGLVLPANVTEAQSQRELLAKCEQLGALTRVDKVLVDKGTGKRKAAALGHEFGMEVEVYGWGVRPTSFQPIARAWRVEVAHGALERSRRLSKSFEQTTTSATAWLELACIADVLDTWSGRESREPTPAERAAREARRRAAPVTPGPRDQGLYTPAM